MGTETVGSVESVSELENAAWMFLFTSSASSFSISESPSSESADVFNLLFLVPLEVPSAACVGRSGDELRDEYADP